MTQASRDSLEAVLGYRFADAELLERALTHSSMRNARRAGDVLERLEFLGDRVLGLLAAETLWRQYPEAPEGELSRRLNALVRTETCAAAALALGLDEHLVLAPSEESAGGRKKPGILSDAMEAVLGALYIDGGLPAARKAFDLFWTPNIERLSARAEDPKTALQEWSQSKGLGVPVYEVTERSGPDHAPVFDVEVAVEGFAPARGSGASKRAAERKAAEIMLVREKIWGRIE